MKRRRKGQRGFSLLAVMLILTVLVAGLLAILLDAGEGLRESGNARSKEMIAGAMEYGLNEAMNALEQVAPEQLAGDLIGTGVGRYDIFANWSAEDFVCSTGGGPGPVPCGFANLAGMTFPPGSPTPDLRVRVGLRMGQRTQAPAGEDAEKSFGYIVEVEVAVSRAGTNPDAAERAVYGVRLPGSFSHAE